MFLFYFRSEKSSLMKTYKNIKIKQKNYYYTLIGPDKKELIKLKKKLMSSRPINLFDILIDDAIIISPINIIINNTIFENAYNIAKDTFIKELIETLDDDNFINFYNNNNIIMPLDTRIPSKFNYITKKKSPIQFRKNIFLQNWDFLREFDNILKKLNKSIEFKKITKYIWKKNITFLNPEVVLPDHNK